MGDSSNNGKYVAAVTLGTSPYLKAWQRNGDTLTELSFPSTPSSAGRACRFSADGRHLLYLLGSAPYVHVYKRAGNTFTLLTNPFSSAPTVAVTSAVYNKNVDGEYLALGMSSSPYLLLYKKVGDTYTALTAPATMPTYPCKGMSFSADGVYLSMATQFYYNYTTYNMPYVYKRVGDTFTKLTTPATEYTAGTWYGAKLSPDGNFLFFFGATSPYVKVYKRTTDTFAVFSYTFTSLNTAVYDVEFSPNNGNVIFCGGYASSPSILMYSRSDNTFPYLALYPVNTNAKAYLALFSKDSKKLFVIVSSGAGTVNAGFYRFTFTDSYTVVQITPVVFEIGGTYNGYYNYSFGIYDP